MRSIIVGIHYYEFRDNNGPLHRIIKTWNLGRMGYWHREDGPAVIHEDGHEEWWYDDHFYEKEKDENN